MPWYRRLFQSADWLGELKRKVGAFQQLFGQRPLLTKVDAEMHKELT